MTEQTNDDLLKQYQKKQKITAAIMILVVITLAVSSFYLGATISCSKSGGTSFGLLCVKLRNVGVCNIGTQQYVIPANYSISNDILSHPKG